MTARLFEIGIGHVVVARRLSPEQIAIGFFLLDAQCLGVKDAGFSVVAPSVFLETKEKMERSDDGSMGLRAIEPAYARKLIESAIAYADGIGFQPHPDYREAAVVFGDIDPGKCPDTFEFGKDGKPLYVSGPHDSESMRARVLATLRARCGEGNYHFIVNVGPASGWGGSSGDEEE